MHKIILLLVLLLFSQIVSADTYTATSVKSCSYGSNSNYQNKPSVQGVCDALQAYYGSTYTITKVAGASSSYEGACNIKNASGVSQGDAQVSCTSTYTCPYGGTLDTTPDGSYCTNAPACLTGQTRNATTGECQAETCVVGDTKPIYVLSGKAGTPSTPYSVKLSKGQTGTGQTTEVINGKKVTVPQTDNNNHGCKLTDGGLIYCSVDSTATCESTTDPDTAISIDTLTTMPEGQCKSPFQWNGTDCTVPQPHKNCFTVANGEEVCVKPLVKNCGTLNGIEICSNNNGLTSGGKPAVIVDGKVTTDDLEKTNENGQKQNCVSKDGKAACLNIDLPSGDLGHVVKLETQPTDSNPTSKDILTDDAVKESKKTKTETAADGSKTVTTTTTTNIYNSTPTTVTETYSSTGEKISTTTQTGDSNGNGSTDGSATAATSTYSGTGRFYTSTGDTVESVSNAFMETAKNSPILKAGKDVFDVQFPTSSSCGNCDLSLPAFMGIPSQELKPFCADWMPAFWSFIASALKVATVLMCVRILITPIG